MIIQERARYQYGKLVALLDIGSVLVTTGLFIATVMNFWDWIFNLPDIAAMGPEAFRIYINQNPRAILELVFSKRTIALIIPVAVVYGLWKYSRLWKHTHWNRLLWGCRLIRWFAASSLLASWLFVGEMDPSENFVFGEAFHFLFGAVISVSSVLIELTSKWFFLALIIGTIVAPLAFIWLTWKEKSLQVTLLAIQVGQFQVLSFAGIFAERMEFGILAWFGGVATLIQAETLVYDLPEGYHMEKFIGTVLATLTLAAIGLVSFYFTLWPYITAFQVIFASW